MRGGPGVNERVNMQSDERKGSAMASTADSHGAGDQDNGAELARSGGSARQLPPRASSGGTPFEVFKSGQGSTVRWCTAIGAFVVAIAFTMFLQEQLAFAPVWARYLVPAATLVGLAYWVFRLVGQNRGTVEFLIATEGEMKKVNWSTRKEVIGATKVVIVTVLALGFLLFFVNLFFLFLFETIGVLRVGGAAAALTPVGQ